MSEWEKELRSFGQAHSQDTDEHYKSAVEIICSGKEYISPSASELNTQQRAYHFQLDEKKWERLLSELAYSPLLLEGMWYDGSLLHALFLDQSYQPLIACLPIEDGRYYGLSAVRKEAVFYERMINDLWGVESLSPVELPPLVDHRKWERMAPCNNKLPSLSPHTADFSIFTEEMEKHLASSKAELIETGPADGARHAPYALHLVANIHHILGAQLSVGYGHRGMVARMRDLPLHHAFPYVARLNAAASIAHQWAFAQAVEQALSIHVSKNTSLQRCILAELERMTAHLSVLIQLWEETDARLLAAHCEKILEEIRDLNDQVCGHRFLMDTIMPSRNSATFTLDQIRFIKAHLSILARYNDELYALYAEATGLRKSLLGKGVLSYPLAMEMNIGGVSGRASGRDYDLRRSMPGYDLKWLSALSFPQGCCEARIRMRLAELTASLRIIHAATDRLEKGMNDPQYPYKREEVVDYAQQGLYAGWGRAESAEGVVWYWVKIEEGRIADISYADPSQKLSIIAEHLLKQAHWTDGPLIVTSLGFSAAGTDG